MKRILDLIMYKPALNFVLSEKYIIFYVELVVLRNLHPSLIILHTVKKSHFFLNFTLSSCILIH